MRALSDQLRGSAVLAIPLLVIVGASAWFVYLGATCSGFDCYGLVGPIWLGLGTTLLQVAVLVPAVGYLRFRAGRPFWAGAATWVAASVAAFLAGPLALELIG